MYIHMMRTRVCIVTVADYSPDIFMRNSLCLLPRRAILRFYNSERAFSPAAASASGRAEIKAAHERHI